jgi:hypothetical protein
LVNGVSLRGETILKTGDRITIGKLELEINIRQSITKTPLPMSTSDIPADAVSNASAVISTTEIPTVAAAAEETSYEVASVTDPATTQQVAQVPADTAIIGSYPAPYPQGNQVGYPQGYPQMMPPGYPMPGGYMPQQYPQYAPGYGQPMGYPMGYPQMMPMQQGYPGVAVAPAAPAAPVESANPTPFGEMAVRLPNPEETGVKPAAPPAPAAPGTNGPANKEEKPSTSAADIIKQYMSRRS